MVGKNGGTMAQKWQAARFGGPEALELVDVDVPPPRTGEVVVDVYAASMNPADYKHIAPGQDPGLLPLSLGFEVAGVIGAIGPDTHIATGGGAVGADEAVDVSLALVKDRNRVVTTAAFVRAASDGFRFVGARNPASAPYRAAIKIELIRLAGAGQLAVPIGRTFAFAEAPAALRLLMGAHPAGKLALVMR